MYALYFLLVTVICVIMMSPTVEDLMKDRVSSGRNVRVLPYKLSRLYKGKKYYNVLFRERALMATEDEQCDDNIYVFKVKLNQAFFFVIL